MSNATLIKRAKPEAAAIPATGEQSKPSRKSLMGLELVLITFNAGNTLKAVAELSGRPEAAQFIDKLPMGKYTNRLEVCGSYKDFLASFISEHGVMTTLESLLKVCSNRVYLNQQRDETKGFVGAWLGTKKAIHQTIAAMNTEGREAL